MTTQQAFALALQHHQAGRFGDAEALYRQILAAQPYHAEALHHLGIIAHQLGRHDLAIDLIRQATVHNPNNPAAYSNLGEAYRAGNRLDEAVASLRRALQLQPGQPEAENNLGNALRSRGQLDDAIAAYHRALELKPDYAIGHYNLGIVLAEQGQLDEAVAAYRRAIHFQPGYPEAYNNLGGALAGLGKWDEAIAAYRRALELQPGGVEAHNNLGIALMCQGQFDEAIAVYRRALELKADQPETLNNLGIALRKRGFPDEAAVVYRRALELQPDFLAAHNNLGNLLKEGGRLDEALAACRRALEISPDDPDTHNNLGNVLKDQGRLDEVIAAYRRAIQVKPDYTEAHSNLVYTLHFHPGQDESMIAAEQQRCDRQFVEPLKRSARPHANDRSPERRLRIGYVSPDFRDHVVARNLVPLFKNHDRRNFEILCYSGVVRPDHLTEDMRQRADQWRGTLGVADDALAETIRQDGVDILVDLSQHMGGNHLLVFARRPAPVQVSFAGYPESTGSEAIGYRISDRYLEGGSKGISDVSERSAQSNIKHQTSDMASEQVFFVDSFWCYDPCGVEVAITGLPARQNGRVTFGSLNNYCKINEPVLKLWARVLAQVEDSRLVLLTGTGSHRQRTLEVLERAGVEAHRVEFAEPRARQAYLKLYHRLDVVLDPFPYDGHTTSLDALWMGVPVVSLAGERAVSRAGFSQLSNLGLLELVAFSEDDYVGIATQLARDLPRLAQMRATLRPRMEASPLMDAPRFARNIEAAYRAMWQQWSAEKSSGHV